MKYYVDLMQKEVNNVIDIFTSEDMENILYLYYIDASVLLENNQ